MKGDGSVAVGENLENLRVYRVNADDIYVASGMEEAIGAAARDSGLKPWDVIDDRDPPRELNRQDLYQTKTGHRPSAEGTLWKKVEAMTKAGMAFPARLVDLD